MWEKIALALLTFGFKALAILPFWALYLLSDLLYYIIYYIARYRRKVVRNNIAKAFPEKSADEIKCIERKFYRHFCDYIFETVKLMHISDEQMKQRLRFTNIELIEQLRGDGRPFFVYLGHYGNWEYVTSITLWVKEGLTACQVYHPLSDKIMDKFFLRLRARFNSVGIPHEKTLRTLLRMKSEGKQALLGLIADQRPRKQHIDYWMEFFHQTTPVITGSEAVGLRLGAHFLYGDVEVTGRGRYSITLRELQPVEGERYSVTRQYTRLLEQTISRAPQYWLWTHKRWKYRYEDYHKEAETEAKK